MECWQQIYAQLMSPRWSNSVGLTLAVEVFSFLLRLATAPIVGALMVNGKSDFDAGYTDLSNPFGSIPHASQMTPRTLPSTPAEYANAPPCGGQGSVGLGNFVVGNAAPVRRESVLSDDSQRTGSSGRRSPPGVGGQSYL